MLERILESKTVKTTIMNHLIILTIIMLIPTPLRAKPWSEILRENSAILAHPTFNLITEQYKSFINHTTPVIASPLIKSIPISDNGEELIDLYGLKNSRISMLPSPLDNKPFSSPLYNSGLPSASKIRKEVYLRLEKMVTYLDEYAELFGYSEGDISIKVFEGLRDLQTQAKLFQSKVEEIRVSNPQLTAEEVETEASKWVSPVKNNIPVHSTGAAIDIRLWQERTQDFIDLGAFGVIWGENKSGQTFSENLTDLQKSNRLYLLMAATKAGLTNYSFEYWHFSCGDRYAAYWQEEEASKRVACYGAIR